MDQYRGGICSQTYATVKQNMSPFFFVCSVVERNTFFLMYFGTSPEFSSNCLCPFLESTLEGLGFIVTAVVVFIKSLFVWRPIIGLSVLAGTAGFLTVKDLRASFESCVSKRTYGKYECKWQLRSKIAPTRWSNTLQENSLSGNLGSFECFLRNLSGSGTSTFAGPIVLIASLVALCSRRTAGLCLDMYL